MYFTPEEIFFMFYTTFIRDAPGISEKDENRSKSTKVTKVTVASAESGSADWQWALLLSLVTGAPAAAGASLD